MRTPDPPDGLTTLSVVMTTRRAYGHLMSTRGERWRHLGVILAGLAVGAICLVMWSSSSASALDAPPHPAPQSPIDVSGVVQQLTAPVDQLLAPVGVDLATVVDPVTEGIVYPTVERPLAELAQQLPQPTVGAIAPDVPPLPGLADVPGMTAPPGADHPSGPAATGSPLDEARPAEAVRRDAGATDDVLVIDATPAPGRTGSSSDPFLPAPADLVFAAAGSLSSTGQGSAGTVLLAVLAGTVVASTGPRPRRLALAGQLSPRAPAFAIVNPPG
jgi:hypothetical protein